MDVSYRQIAKFLARGMPVDGQEYSDIIEDYIKALEAMPPEHQQTLRASYIFSRKVPRDDRQDMFQHFVAHGIDILSNWPKPIKDLEPFCYAVIRHEWMHVTRDRKRHIRMLNGGFLSLNEAVSDSEDGDTELQETIADDLDLESQVSSKLDCQAVLKTLPDRVKAVVVKRLRGEKLSSHEYEGLYRYRKENVKAIRVLVTG